MTREYSYNNKQHRILLSSVAGSSFSPCDAVVVRAVLRWYGETGLVWVILSYLIEPGTVLILQALGALPVPAVLLPPPSPQHIYNQESDRASLAEILTAHVTEEVRSVQTPPWHRVGSALSEAEDELIAKTLRSPEGPTLRVPAAGWALQILDISNVIF